MIQHILTYWLVAHHGIKQLDLILNIPFNVSHFSVQHHKGLNASQWHVKKLLFSSGCQAPSPVLLMVSYSCIKFLYFYCPYNVLYIIILLLLLCYIYNLIYQWLCARIMRNMHSVIDFFFFFYYVCVYVSTCLYLHTHESLMATVFIVLYFFIFK